MINLISLLPIFSLGWYLYFLKNNKLNNVFSTLIFLSFLMFATNYDHYGLEIDIYRYLHRLIGIFISVSLIFYVLKNRVNFFKELPILILVFFLVILLISYFGNDIYMDYYFHYVRNFIFISLIVSYLFFKVNTNSKIDELFKLILYLTVIMALMIVYEVISEDSWQLRANLFYSNPNYLAYALMPGFVLAIYSENKYKWVMAALLLYAIFATGSRSIELGAVVIIVFFLFYKNINRTLFFSSLAGLVLLCYLILFSSLPFFSDIVKNSNLDKSRLATAYISLKMIDENPVNGIGYGQFRIKYVDYVDQDVLNLGIKALNDSVSTHNPLMTDKYILAQGYYRNMEIMTHNDLLTIVSELGMIGLAFILYVTYKLFYELKQLSLYNRKYFYISLSLIMPSLVFSLFHNNLTSFMFWFIILLPFIFNRNFISKLND
jgi:O-antigen ligase